MICSASSAVCGPPRDSVQEIAQKRFSPSTIVWRPCVRLPSMPMRMSLNSLNIVRPSEASIASASCASGGSSASESSSTLLPLRRRGAVVEHRLADDLDLHLTLDAFDHAHEQVVGVEVRRRAGVAGAVLVVVPFAHRQRVDHADPTLRRHPRRLDHVRSRDVAAPGRDVHAVRARRASFPRRDRAARRRPTASRSTAGTSTRSSRRRRAARRCGSPTGSRSRRSAETESRRRRRRRRPA